MTLPKPEPGLVIRYSYLWYAEYAGGQEEGIKDRPCALVMAAQSEDGGTVVTVLPVTHREPANAGLAMEIPQITKRRLGLDAARSWVLFGESNQFVWPGPDLRPVPGGDISTAAYGMLPPNFFHELRERYVAAFNARRSKSILRTE